ncbi:MAG: hypothetical protein ACYTXC_12290 [Nostoc sp.]
MNDENNQELVKAVDKVTREIKRTNEKINAIFIGGIGLFVLTITITSDDIFRLISGGFSLSMAGYLMISSERKF